MSPIPGEATTLGTFPPEADQPLAENLRHFKLSFYMKYDALIFDCDGTLADTMPAHYITWKEVLNRHGISFSLDRFYSLGGVPAKEVVEIVAGEADVRVDTRAVAEEKDRAFMGQLETVRPVEPVAAVAREYRGKLPMAVATGSHRELAERTLDLIGMAGWFDAVVCAEDVVNPKPAPDIFLEAARRLGIEPARCCVYEDADLGILAACRAGMHVVDVRGMGNGEWGVDPPTSAPQ
jgi:beta-phosphoglucomutase-like phosphatase (HAD superfamily)